MRREAICLHVVHTQIMDCCQLLRTALNIHWNQLLTNEQLYGSLPKISEKIRRRRLKLAGHCRRSDGEIAANLVLWTPKHGQRKQGRPALTYIDLLRKDTDIPAGGFSNCMIDRTVWLSITARADRRPFAIRRRCLSLICRNILRNSDHVRSTSSYTQSILHSRSAMSKSGMYCFASNLL